MAAQPDAGNTQLAAQLNQKHPDHDFKPGDVSAQRQAMKKGGGGGRPASKRPQKTTSGTEAASAARVTVAPRQATGTEGVGDLLRLAERVGGLERLRDLCDLLIRLRS